MTEKSDNYDEKYVKIKLNLDNELPLNKTIKVSTMKIVPRAVSHENNKYYLQVFLEECLYRV